MKQVSRRLHDGRIDVVDVPTPAYGPHDVLVELRASLLSAGTERSKLESGRSNLLQKARQRPDQVRQVMDAVQRDGLGETVPLVRARLRQPTSIGYSAAGEVRAVGALVADLRPGDRVACGGEGFAAHAELDVIPGNLCSRIPDDVSFSEAAFATVGAIALHGVRQADTRVGERVAVIGAGLVGQLSAQILRASGCTVVAIDLDRALLERAATAGYVDYQFARSELEGISLPEAAAECDAVLITAATSSDDPVALAARLSRDRGRVVIVGDVGLTLQRAAYFEKELELRISRSYGPGRYDRDYEERGLDYPIGYVRWTERRNQRAVLELIRTGRIDVAGLLHSTFPVERAEEAYEVLMSTDASPLGLLLEYGTTTADLEVEEPPVAGSHRPPADPRAVGIVGAGNFAQRTVIPGLQAADFRIVAIASGHGLSARFASKGIQGARAVDVDEMLSDPEIGLGVICTRHDTHAALAEALLGAGKPVFVEKPPALDQASLARLAAARDRHHAELWVGFNRRHAPLIRTLRASVDSKGRPWEVLVRVNAGILPADHWLNDPVQGGGRLLGEGCHFVDLVSWIVGALPIAVTCSMLPDVGMALQAAQRFTVVLEYADGSVATILYGNSGAPGASKELIEAHCGGRTATLDNFRRLTVTVGRKHRIERSRRQDRGHHAQFQALRAAIEGKPHDDLDPLSTMSATLEALRSAEQGRKIPLGPLS